MELDSTPFELSGAIKEVLQTAKPLAARNGNRLEVDYAGATGFMMETDEQKFRQSLLNLVGNACKFTTDGCVSVSVEQSADEGQDLVSVRVSDTGIGIAADRMSKLFQPFSQVDSRDNRKFGGTGLGLVISQTILSSDGRTN